MELQEQIRRLSASEKYQSLVNKHRRVIYLLTGIAVFQFSLYFLVIAWAPALAGTVWPAGGAVSIIIWLSVLIILLSIVISGAYLWWTAKYHDPQKEALMRELWND